MTDSCAGAMAASDQSNLCKAHNDASSQLKADNTTAPVAAVPFVASTFASLVDIACGRIALRSASYRSDRLAPDGSPPLFLRLLVLRD